jgi:phage recombination protein Bet
MSNELTQLPVCDFSPENIKLLKNSVCKGATDLELQLFMHVCTSTGLNPFLKQIYSIRRRSKDKFGNWIETQTIQTSIDGLRLIAEKTKSYAPGKEPTYCYDENKNLISATCHIKKRTCDGVWHDVSATALNNEFNPNVNLYPGTKPNSFWEKMPHVMLAKCAEAAALRKSFPETMSGIYSDDEMAQAKPPVEHKEETIEIDPKLLEQQKEKKQLDFENFAYFFKKEEFSEADRLLVVEYLFAYSDRWKKTAEETMERFADEEEFLKNFNLWKSKRVQNESKS